MSACNTILNFDVMQYYFYVQLFLNVQNHIKNWYKLSSNTVENNVCTWMMMIYFFNERS